MSLPKITEPLKVSKLLFASNHGVVRSSDVDQAEASNPLGNPPDNCAVVRPKTPLTIVVELVPIPSVFPEVVSQKAFEIVLWMDRPTKPPTD